MIGGMYPGWVRGTHVAENTARHDSEDACWADPEAESYFVPQNELGAALLE